MAITKILNIKSQSNLYNAIDYIMKPEKTKEQLWVGGNSGSTTQEVYRTMMDTKQAWGKLDGRKGYHIIISWKPGECTEEKAYQIIQEFCQGISWERTMIMCLELVPIENIAMVILCSIP